MTDIMNLGVSITADDKDALAALKRVENAGQQMAGKLGLSVQQAAGALKALGFAAKIASVEGIERIVVEGRQLEVVNRILGRMAPGMTALATEAVKAAAATEKVVVAAKAGGISYQRWGNVAIRASGAMMLMGDALEGNEKSMQQILRTGASIAFMFGPTGAIVGAVGIAASFMVKAWDKAQESIRKAKEETQKLIDMGKELTSAPGFASLGSARELGFRQMTQLATLRKQVADAEAQNLLAQKQWASASRAPGEAFAKPVSKKVIADWKEQIANLEKATVATVKLTGVLTTHEQAEQDAADAVKAATEAQKERIRVIEGEVGWLAQLRDLGAINITQASRARELEIQYTQALAAGNMTIEAQIQLLKRLAEARKASGGLGGAMERGEQPQVGGPRQNPNVSPFAMGAQRAVDRNIAGAMASLDQSAGVALQSIGEQGAVAFATGFASGLAGAMSGAGIDELGKGILASFGNLLIQLGTQGLIANKLVLKMFSFLGTPAGFAAAIGMIALGTALSALGGGGRGGGGRGGGGRSYGGGGSSGIGQGAESRATQYSFNPQSGSMRDITPQKPETNFYAIFGGGPQVERWISKVATKADRRQLGKRRMGVRINGG